MKIKLKLLFLSVFCLSGLISLAQPSIEWQKTFGGTGDEQIHEVIQTKDGGYLFVGASTSGDIIDSTTAHPYTLFNHGLPNQDMYLIKVNSSGNMQWQKMIGCFAFDWATDAIQTMDGGYLVCGVNGEQTGDASGAAHIIDFWVIKLDTTGAILWDKFFGGTNGEVPESIVQLKDGGFILSGFAYSFDGNVSGNHGADDAWVIKLNSIGELQWQKCLGGGDHDYAWRTIEAADGSLIVGGSSNSTDGDVFGTHGLDDYWLIKLNKYGDFQWQRCYGGSQRNELNDIIQADDGGYVLAGFSASTDGDVKHHILRYDYWIVKVNSVGDLEWENSYGGENDDATMQLQSDFSKISIDKTKDGGYVIGGSTRSFAGDVSGNHGKNDYWILKIDKDGNKQWQKCLGGSDEDYCSSVIQTSDGGYFVIGFSYSKDGDVAYHHNGAVPNSDVWVVKLSAVSGIEANTAYSAEMTVFPNPNSGYFSINTDITLNSSEAFSVIIRDVTGKVVYEKELSSVPAESLKINASVLSAGVYSITCVSAKKCTSQKIIIR